MESFFCFTLLSGMTIVHTNVHYKLKADKELKYILPWTYDAENSYDWYEMGFPANSGREDFVKKKCRFDNCYVTPDRNYFGDNFTNFHAVAFIGKELVEAPIESLPQMRSPHQKFVFMSVDAADNVPLCNSFLNGFFNWTWTYRLDSDAIVPYLFVKDKQNRIIGPRKRMNWLDLDEMEDVSAELKAQLSTKTKAAAWFVSNCDTRSRREVFVAALNARLSDFNLSVDIYGMCGELQCYEESHGECLKMLSRDYYFYMAFEQAFSEDFVTEKLLHALQNNAVPIVYGGADYAMFMADGMYLNARELGVDKLAITMNNLMQHPSDYYNYFRWKNHYSYHAVYESPLMDGFCKICEMLNTENFMGTMIRENFRDWWNAPGTCPKKRKTIWDY